MSNKTYDVIIIGGGPAGLTSAIYTAREKMSTLLLEKAMCGGWLIYTDRIENYPGFPEGVKGPELAMNFKAQAQRFGAEIIESAEVTKVIKKDNAFEIETPKEKYTTKSVIITTGTAARKLNIPGEDEYTGKGVSYCATCDGPLFREKDLLVVGGAHQACEETLFLTKFAKKIYMVHSRDKLFAPEVLIDQIKNNKKIELLLSHKPVSISGEALVKSATIENIQTKEQRQLNVSGVFVIHVGFNANTEFVKGTIDLDEKGFIKTDFKMQTSIPGIFSAGDILSGNIRQVAVACGNGVTAALSVRDYLKNV